MRENAYHVLGVQEGASQQKIKDAYRRLAMKHHPDRGGNAEEFKRIQNAYDYLQQVGDHVPLRTREHSKQESKNWNPFNISTIDLGEVSWYTAFHGSLIVKAGVPPGAVFHLGTVPMKVSSIALKTGMRFKYQYQGPDEMFVGDIIGTCVLQPHELESGCWIVVAAPFEDCDLKIRVPAKSKRNQILKIRGQGYWNWKRGKVSRADFYLVLDLEN